MPEVITRPGVRRTRYVKTRDDGQFVKWDFLSPAQMQSYANTPFEQAGDWDDETGSFTYGPGKCECGHPLPTEAEFAKHFVVPDLRFLNLGNCPNRKVTV